MLEFYFCVNKYILAEHETFNWQNNINAENSTRYRRVYKYNQFDDRVLREFYPVSFLLLYQTAKIDKEKQMSRRYNKRKKKSLARRPRLPHDYQTAYPINVIMT